MQTTLTGEMVYYGDREVWVTSQRFVVGKKSYPLADIDNVEVGEVPGEQWADKKQQSFDWAKVSLPSIWLVVMFKIGPDPAPLAVLTALFVLTSLAMWRWSSSKPATPALQLVPVYVIKLKGKKLRHVVFASLEEDHTRGLADLISDAVRAQRKGESPLRVLEKAHIEPPRGNTASPALATYFMDGMVWVTSEVVHVGRDSYPLHHIKAAYVHYGRIDWYTAYAADGYFIILNIHGALVPALATTDSDYAYNVRDAILAALKRLAQDRLRRGL
jgi:hypothetical protein